MKDTNNLNLRTYNEKLSFWAVAFLSLFMFLMGLFFAHGAIFYKPVPLELSIYSSIDHLLMIIAVWIVFKAYRNKISLFLINIQFSTDRNLKKLFPFLFIIVIILWYYAALRFSLIFDGATREQLMSDVEKERFVMLFSSFVVVLFAVSVFFKSKWYIRATLLSGFIAISIHSMSRSYLLCFIYLLIVFHARKGTLFDNKKQILFMGVLVLLVAGTITIFQGRASDLSTGLSLAFETFFRYKSFPFQLSEFAIHNAEFGYEKLFFPFFGFCSERFFSVFFTIDYPISVNGSAFVFEFHRLGYLGTSSANVLYPWWAWFYGSFGWLGLLIKFSYIVALLKAIMWLKLYVTFFSFISMLLFQSWSKHPFLNNDSVYFWLGIILIDLFLRIKMDYSSYENSIIE